MSHKSQLYINIFVIARSHITEINSRQLTFFEGKIVILKLYKHMVEPKDRDVSGPQVDTGAKGDICY